MAKVTAIRSGGQSGADRGAMDAARACGVTVKGWCPAGGWAEDYPEPPGVLALYPEMLETPSREPIQRTEWNIRDSTCCLVFNPRGGGASPGTDAGFAFNERYGIPHRSFEIDDPATYDAQLDALCEWLEEIGGDIEISVGGPRASEYPGIYDIVFAQVKKLLERMGAHQGQNVSGV